MRTTREPVLIPVDINDLRPTQLTIGLEEVRRKRRQWRDQGEAGGEFLGRHMIPVCARPETPVLRHRSPPSRPRLAR
jgi:hypothetical protein